MNDKLILALYVIALGFIVLGLFDFWLISIIFMLLLIITILQKISAEEKIEKVEKSRGKLISLITEKLDKIANGVNITKNDVNRNMFILENRISEVRYTYENEMEKYYRDLARKIFDVENKLNAVKKTLGAAYGSIDERLQMLEKE